MKKKLAIYTVLIGEKEDINDPLQIVGQKFESDLDIEFYCLTDNINLESKTWKICYYSHPLISAEKSSRYPKARPDIFFPDYDYSIYIDNTVVLKRIPLYNDIENSILKGFRHPWRSNPIDEADIVVKSGLDDSITVVEQMKYYEKERSISQVNYLSVGTVIVRNHKDFKVIKFGQLWWEQILLHSKRDQLSLDLCAKEAGCSMEYYEGDKLSNDLFLWPVIANGHRILGSFDSEYYAWKNRKNKEAVKNPKKHFLQNQSKENYDRKNSIFNYACDKNASSLGFKNFPKRGISNVIENYLNVNKKNFKALIIGVRSDQNYDVEKKELINAKKALIEYYKYNDEPVVILSELLEIEFMQDIQFLQAGGCDDFDLILVLGTPIKYYNNIFEKFMKLLNYDGVTIIHFGECLDLNSINKMHVNSNFSDKINIYHGISVEGDNIIPNCIFSLKNNGNK
jgi:hypothetical protein